MDSLDFSEEEIQEQLAALGYKNIPKHRLIEFKRDLDKLIQDGELKSLATATHTRAEPSTSELRHQLPAFTKEKVSQCYIKSNGEGFFLHPGKGGHDRQPLAPNENRSYGWQQTLRDAYAYHSVAPRLQPPPEAPSRLQVEADPEDSLPSLLSNSATSSPDTQQRHFIKRKVLRKHKGQSLVCDESFYSEDSDVASRLEEQLADLQLSTSARRRFEAEEDASTESDAQSSQTDGISLSAFESYIRGMTGTRSDGDVRQKPKSFIRPVMSQQTLKKTDPVAKYFQYKQLWDMFKLPGEADRKALRWEIKERLAYQPPPPKPRRVYVPNTYVVPTEKKRSALRWEVRNDLASGLPPHRFTYRF
ncbi:centriolar and ciliogenesis-associated protein HYLS1 isoform 1-T3 [Menidia menidia]